MAGYYDSRLGQALSLMGNARMVNPFEGVSSAFANIANLGFKAQEAERQQNLDTQNKQLFDMNMQRLQREKQQADLKDIYNRYGQYTSTTPQQGIPGLPAFMNQSPVSNVSQEPIGNIPASEFAKIGMTSQQYGNAIKPFMQEEQTRALNLANAEQAQQINALKLAQAQTEQAENTLPVSQSPFASIAKQFKVPDNITVSQFKQTYDVLRNERDYASDQYWKGKNYALEQQSLSRQAKSSNMPEWAYKLQQNQLATGFLDNSISTLGTVENALAKAYKDRTEDEKKQIRNLDRIGAIKGRKVDRDVYSKKVYESFVRGGGTETPIYQDAQANAKVIYAANYARLKELSKNKGKLDGAELQEYNQLSESMKEGISGITRKILFGLDDRTSGGADIESMLSDIRFTPPLARPNKVGYNGTGSPQTLNPMPSRTTPVNPSGVINYMEGRR